MIWRNITARLQEALDQSPVVFLNGARQVGKSTLAQAILKGTGGRYLSLDEPDVLSAAATDPRALLADFEGLTVIDEVQKAPALFSAIKVLVDRNRAPGRFLLTGSANVLTLPKVSDSLAGRMQLVTLHPLSQGEKQGLREGFIPSVFADKLPESGTDPDSDLFPRVLMSGYPELAGTKDSRKLRNWYSSYITTLLQRDVRDLSGITGLSEMPRLLALLAARCTSLVNRSSLARDLGWPRSNLVRYLSLLEMVFLFEFLPAWSGNLGKKLTRSPKIMFEDLGLAAHLVGADPGHLPEDRLMGALLENFVVMELRRQASWSEPDVQLHHFRTSSGDEVDLILEDRRGRVVAIEIKASATPSAAMFNPMRRLAERLGERFHRGILLSRGETHLAFGPDLYSLPIHSLWSLGAEPNSS